MSADGSAISTTLSAVDALLALEAIPGGPQASYLPGTSFEDQRGYFPFTYDAYHTLPDIAPGGTLQEGALPDDDFGPLIPSRAAYRKQKNAAQQRYRQRLKQREEDSQTELQAVAQRLQELQVETRQLAARQKLMLQLMAKQETRICLLVNSQECMQLEAQLLPQELAAVMSTAGCGDVTAEDAKQWTLQQYLEQIFPELLARMAKLLPAAAAAPMGPESAILNAIVHIRRAAEARRALYIQLHSVLLSWNLQQTQKLPPEQLPSPAFWRRVLEGLQLSKEQQHGVLALRERVILWLAKACQLRAESYTAVGYDLAWRCQDMNQGRGVCMLRSALELERRAAGHFFYEFVAEVLTPHQEAWLDAGPICPPWAPNFWLLGEALADQHGQAPAPKFEAIYHVPVTVQPYMPTYSGLQLLAVDCLAHGGGTQLKRGMLCCWYITTRRQSPGSHASVMELHPRPQELLQHTVMQLQSERLPEY